MVDAVASEARQARRIIREGKQAGDEQARISYKEEMKARDVRGPSWKLLEEWRTKKGGASYQYVGRNSIVGA